MNSKNSKPVPPTTPEPAKLNGYKEFCSYLARLMVNMPRNEKLRLQCRLINMTTWYLNKLNC